MIKQIWIEQDDLLGFDAYQDSTNVIVETDDGLVWVAEFATIPYLQRQMYLSREVAMGISPNVAPTRFVAIETPQVVVENLLQDTIEDTIDNMMTLGIFESVFTLHADDHVIPA